MLPLIKVLEAPPPKARQPMPEEIDIDDKEDEEVRSANVRRREEGGGRERGEGGVERGGGRGGWGRGEEGGGRGGKERVGGRMDMRGYCIIYMYIIMLNFGLVPRCSVPCIRTCTLCNSFLYFFFSKRSFGEYPRSRTGTQSTGSSLTLRVSGT